MSTAAFGIIGGGWRAEFFLRIARELPERFRVTSMLIRNEEKAKAIEAEWGVKTFRTLDDFMKGAPFSFVVVSVGWDACPVFIAELAKRGVPVLAETPPAPDIAGLVELYETVGPKAKVQVAEQYLFQPMHAARIALARSGKLGQVSQAQVSAAHGYHGISLIRNLLGVRFQDATISGQRFVSPITGGPGRSGPPETQKTVEAAQDIALFRFGDRLGVFDFTGEQYFSYIRRHRVLVRGDKGEIVDREMSCLRDFRTPIYTELKRQDAGHNGNLDGFYLKGIMADSEWVYRNPFIPGRLSDDEIAVATSLQKMAEHVDGGPSFYSLAEASQDHYLSILMNQAIQTNTTVTSTRQIWAGE